MSNKIELQTINAESLPVIEWQGVRVVTTEILAVGYGTEDKNIRMNLANNRDRFIEGVHVFILEGEALREFKNRANSVGSVGKNARSLTLWAERGAARMSKIVDTDEAWSFFEKMEHSYFHVRETALAIPDLSRLDILQMAIESEQGRLAEKNRADEAERTKALIGSRREATAMARASVAIRERNKLAEKLGESQKHATVKAVERLTGVEYEWRPLRKWCKDNDHIPVDVPDPRFGVVKSWPREAWLAVHGVELQGIQP